MDVRLQAKAEDLRLIALKGVEELAARFKTLVPESRELSLAMTKLDEARLWIWSAIDSRPKS